MYRDFLDHYSKDISSQESLPLTFGVKFDNFKSKVAEIVAHNSDKTHGWTKGINQFSDMTDEEFFEYYHLDNYKDVQNCSATEEVLTGSETSAPSSWDWRDLGVVTPVKDQGSCGSCWTFSTVGALEAHYQINYNLTGKNVSFSEQELLDCAYGDRWESFGCYGGLPSYAGQYIIGTGGLQANATYSYEAASPAETPARTCLANKTLSVVGQTGGFNITAGNETQMLNHLHHFGPVAISYEVVADFRDYSNGTYSSPNCGTTNMDVNHAVTAVGYGTDSNGMDYWIVKNSWGPRWGNKGYFNIERNANMCAVAQCNSHPVGVHAL